MKKEDDTGNIEYKLLLDNLDEEKLEKLAAQMLYRLNEGHGEAYYVLGLSDEGEPIGLSDDALKRSLDNLDIVARRIGAITKVLRTEMGEKGAIAEVYVRRTRGSMPTEISIALLGNADAGKSTLKGVLTYAVLDDGNGYAMSLVARYIHEIKMRRTSAVNVHIIGFDEYGNMLNDQLKTYDEADIFLRSAKVINLIDLAGHEKYFKTTLRGIMGNLPDYVLLVVSLASGPVGTFKEHLGISLALGIPIFIVMTKRDLAPKPVAEMALNEVIKIIKMPGVDKIPLVVRDKSDTIVAAKNIAYGRVVPIFMVSNRTGEGLQELKYFLNLLPKRVKWEEKLNRKFMLYVDEVFNVQGVGTVVSGIVEEGSISEGSEAYIGPNYMGEFEKVKVVSIQKNRVPVQIAYAGQYITLALSRVKPEDIRKGMVIVQEPSLVKPVREFVARVKILHHPTLIKPGYEPVIQFRTLKEVAKIVESVPKYLKSGDTGSVRFRFKYYPVVIEEGETFVFREGKTRGVGYVMSLLG